MKKEEKVPNGYKDTSIGQIPVEWSEKAICEVIENKNSALSLNSLAPNQGVYPLFGASGFIKNIDFYQQEKPFIAIVKDGAGIGNSFICPGQSSILGTLSYLNPKEGCNIDFIFNILQSTTFEKYITGSTIPHIYFSNYSLKKIPFPPLPEQTAIANLLSTWDSAIQTTNALIEQKQNRKKWLMQMLLTGKKRLKGFEKEKWKKYSYENVLKVVKRPFEMHDDELYNLISVRRRSGGIFAREPLLGKQILVKQLRTANEGDFLFSKMQILHGASALVTKEFAGYKISGSYIAAVAQDPKTLNLEFFEWYSRLPIFYHQTYISSYGVHIEKMTFDWDSFMGLGLKLPSAEEQKEIVNVLNTSAKEIKLLQTQLEQLKEQKKGLMQILLTGKKRLKVN